jgi:2,4-dienoyl-CoA reductase-like NADH-dependent reductase (Old Yellow Enzyme family)
MLFERLKIRDIEFRNRIVVSPMCQYSSEDGFANDWHLVHLGSRAIGGAALVLTEATAVTPEGRISSADLGIWKDDHIAPLHRVTAFIQAQGAVAGIQLAHAGRKASVSAPWKGNHSVPAGEGGWQPLAPSPIPFKSDNPVPHELTTEEIAQVVDAFRLATIRAVHAGFGVIEIHAAHGYLIHEFLSPVSNHRTDQYGGPFDNRIRIVKEIATAVRASWPAGFPLFVRISSTDWTEGGWTPDDSVGLAKELTAIGVDLIDCSSGGNVNGASIPLAPKYQVPFAEKIKRESGALTGAVGLITTAQEAEEIISAGRADMIFLARQMLRDPYFPIHAARELGDSIDWPIQYERAK